MEIIFKKVHTPKDLILSGLIFAAGIGLFFASKGIGIAVMLCGLIMFCVYKIGYKRDGGKWLLQKVDLELCSRCKTSVINFMEGREANPELIIGNDGGTLLLEIWYNRGQCEAYVRLSEYRDYAFHAITETIELNDNSAKQLIAKL